MRQADVVRELEVDKGTVSKWFSGTVPRDDHLHQLAELFDTTIDGLFMEPSDAWLVKFFQTAPKAQRDRAREILELFFSKDADKVDVN